MNVLFEHILKNSYWAKKLVVLFLCRLYMLTNGIKANTFKDLLFLLKESLFHAVIVALSFATLLWSMYDDALVIHDLIDEVRKEWKEFKDTLDD